MNRIGPKRHPTKADDRKSVWHYFLQGGDSAKCNIATCGKVLKCVGGSTKGLHIHLASKHSINLLRKESVADSYVDNDVVGLNTAQPSGPAPKKVKITSYFLDKQERSLPAVLSRMTARDGLPFSFAPQLRAFFKEKIVGGHEPRSGEGVGIGEGFTPPRRGEGVWGREPPRNFY